MSRRTDKQPVLSVYLAVCLTVCLSIYFTVCLSLSLSVYLSVCLSGILFSVLRLFCMSLQSIFLYFSICFSSVPCQSRLVKTHFHLPLKIDQHFDGLNVKRLLESTDSHGPQFEGRQCLRRDLNALQNQRKMWPKNCCEQLVKARERVKGQARKKHKKQMTSRCKKRKWKQQQFLGNFTSEAPRGKVCVFERAVKIAKI